MLHALGYHINCQVDFIFCCFTRQTKTYCRMGQNIFHAGCYQNESDLLIRSSSNTRIHPFSV